MKKTAVWLFNNSSYGNQKDNLKQLKKMYLQVKIDILILSIYNHQKIVTLTRISKMEYRHFREGAEC